MTDDKPWLSLPDEDPPERGLAELMAAARVKAEIMARPPWWKRALDLMKRPPVLALATVVLLLGGVIVVGHHHEDVQAPTIQPESTPVVAPGAGSAAVPQQVEALPEPPEPPPPPPKPAHHRAEPPKLIKAAPPPPEKQKSTAGAAKLELAEPTTEDDAETVDKTAVKAPVPRGEPLSVQLRRCRAAATNKDCAGAKTCAQQLEQRDRAYYDANVANDATLKSCL